MFQVVLPEERLTIRRAEVMAKMHAAGIGTGVHYPAIHLFAVYRRLGWKDGDPFLVGSDPASFAKKCVELHSDERLWSNLRHAALGRIQKECSTEVFEANVRDILTYCKGVTAPNSAAAETERVAQTTGYPES